MDWLANVLSTPVERARGAVDAGAPRELLAALAKVGLIDTGGTTPGAHRGGVSGGLR